MVGGVAANSGAKWRQLLPRITGTAADRRRRVYNRSHAGLCCAVLGIMDTSLLLEYPFITYIYYSYW